MSKGIISWLSGLGLFACTEIKWTCFECLTPPPSNSSSPWAKNVYLKANKYIRIPTRDWELGFAGWVPWGLSSRKRAEVGLCLHLVVRGCYAQEPPFNYLSPAPPSLMVDCAYAFSCVRLFGTPWTVACHAPLSIELSRQEYCSGLHFPFQKIFMTQGSNSGLLSFLHWQAGSLPAEPPGKLADGLPWESLLPGHPKSDQHQGSSEGWVNCPRQIQSWLCLEAESTKSQTEESENQKNLPRAPSPQEKTSLSKLVSFCPSSLSPSISA